MVDFVRLQEIARERLERDRAVQFVEAVGPTLETAVSDAAALLDLPIRHIEYEIIEKGTPGFMGIGKKEWRIQAYEHAVMTKKKLRENLFADEDGEELPMVEDHDGDAFVHLNSNGEALLKVTAPSGNGRKVPEIYVRQLLADRGVTNIDTQLVSKVINDALGAYIKAGDYEHISVNDSIISALEIPDGEMRAVIQVSAPGTGGCDISFDAYVDFLKTNRVVFGVKEDILRNLVDQPVYGEKIEIAEGSKPVDGRSAYIQYNFETDQSKVRLREGSNGKVDFKELNIIQNVVENQPLARKIPPETGAYGETVTGKMLPAKDGKDINLPVGANVHVDEDGETILSNINGQVLVVNGLINVEPVFVVNGDVNLKTGNIIFLGTVIVNGNIEDGFSVKAAGNIEVKGTVAKAELDAEGDIIIHQGINGKGGGLIQAGKSLWARFIENTNIQTGDMVIASDGIINSRVDAANRIICQGKRACIMGGRLRAIEEINAKVLGNPTTGTETILEVGYDPKSKERLEQINVTKEKIERELEDIKRNIQTLTNIKKQQKTLPDDKETALQEFTEKRRILVDGLQKEALEAVKINEYLGSIRARGRVSASAKVFPGVKVAIRDAKEEVRTEYRAVTFILENGLVRVTKYEEPDEGAVKGPDGYSTN